MCDSETCAGEPEKRQAEQLTLEAEFNKYFTVFDGSSPEDVSHAKQLWTSLSLLPLLESRLISADISQRLPVAKTNHESTTAVRPSSSDLKAPGGFSLEAETGGKAEVHGHGKTETGDHLSAASTETEQDTEGDSLTTLQAQTQGQESEAGCLPPQGSGNRCGGSPKASVTHTLKHAHLHTHSNMHIYTHINKIQNTTNHKHDPKYYQI
ncbi:UPF0722 protein C11orf88 homolog isoform X1 [Esox lucius]|uniref:UPF0722 protein C11orf88 homolog isoform X1 n=1 Tax=Esox lucius TaxID=8010 RepID=UPI0010BDA929|nr:UPF0722 protein C11orf88 homolog isoform X1 [Esox lucius]